MISNSESISEEKVIHKKTSFIFKPNLEYGSKKDLLLNDIKWCEFQILLLFEKKMSTKDISFHLYKAGILTDSNSSRRETIVQNLFEKFENNFITKYDFLLKSKIKQNSSPISVLNSKRNSSKLCARKLRRRKTLANSCLSFPDKSENKDDIQKLLLFFKQLYESNKLSKNDFDFISMAISSLNSVKTFFNFIKEKYGSKKIGNNMIYTALGSMLFDEKIKNDFSVNNISFIFNMTKNFIQETYTNIHKFKNNQQETLARTYDSHLLYTPQTVTIARTFWKLETESHPGGRNVTCTRKLKDGTKETHEIKFLPCGIGEFYERFELSKGHLCSNWKNEHEVPKLTWFMNLRPWYVRKSRSSQKTCYCTLCLKFEYFLRSFAFLVRKHCTCTTQECQNFVHQEECQFYDLDEPASCECQCECDLCLSCCKIDLTSFSKFCLCLCCTGVKFDYLLIPKLKCF